VSDWAGFERDAPGLAAWAHERLIAPGVLLVATTRRDGTPRVSPVEPFILDGSLLLSMMWRSFKAEDLLRDSRVLLHSIVTSRDGSLGEVKVRGHAIRVDASTRSRYCDAVAVLGWQPVEPYFHLFRIDVDDVTLIRYATDESGDQFVARWPLGIEFLRRATSSTSVGTPEATTGAFTGTPRG